MRFLLLFLLFFPVSLQAAYKEDLDYSAFAHIPVLHEGRIKPLDSFARVFLKKMYGDKSLPDEAAISWLAQAMFDPQDAMQEPIFVVRVPEVVSILSLPKRTYAVYSFSEMAAVMGGQEQLIKGLLAKDKKALTADDQELIRLYMNVSDFAEIAGAFSLLLPFPDNPDLTYLDTLKSKEKIDAALKETVKLKGDKIEQYSEEEQRNAKLSYRISVLEALDSHNILLRIIPPAWQGTEEWLSPWAVIENGAGSPASLALFHDWQALAKAYNSDDAASWNALSEKLYQTGVHSPHVRPFSLSLEVFYNAVDPLNRSIIGYIIGVLVTLTYIVLSSRGVAKEWLRIAAYTIILISTGMHGLALLMRVAILMRPPVSTLYESMIFVSFMSSCFGLWMEWKKKGGESLLISGIIASLLIAAANVFAADSDTLEVLVAVLNTNFWLGTHVVCITTGYASALVAGAIAHIYLIKRALGKTEVTALMDLQRRLHSIALVALLFTSVGTMLGGIWADQSWGRFWGWDPKENGALWIVLWLIWALHGRIAGQLREVGFACVMAFITIVVALAWVGVNLLSVGLHSYGFTDVAANSLMVFCGTEIVLIGGVTVMAVRRSKFV